MALATIIAVALSKGKNLQELQCLANLISNVGLQMINIANQVALQKGEPDISFL